MADVTVAVFPVGDAVGRGGLSGLEEDLDRLGQRVALRDPLHFGCAAEGAAQKDSGNFRREQLGIPAVKQAEVFAIGAGSDVDGVEAVQFFKRFHFGIEPEGDFRGGKLQTDVLVKHGKLRMVP
jgi:hypothetical protein